jgi:hypothetical protein
MFDLAKGLKDINDASIRNASVIELQEQILAAQVAQAELIERVRELEKEVASFKRWDAEKEKYELKDIGQGAFVCMRKDGAEPRKPPHWLCTKCYRDGKDSIFLRTETRSGFGKVLWLCPECSSTISVDHRITPSQLTPPPMPAPT